MLKKIHYFLLILSLIACSSKDNTFIADYNIVPAIQDIKNITDQSFTLNSSTKISYPIDNEKLRKVAEMLSEYIDQITGYKLNLTNDSASKNTIVLTTNFSNENTEAYVLNVNPSQIIVNGASESGVFYGIQTLRKSIPAIATGEIKFPGVEISDFPAYGHRGVHLDVSRHFFPVSFVKKYMDIMAMFNMNVFHWHLTDDQGWRIEIKKYPKLTEIGSQREKTIIGRHTGEFDNTAHGGFYTQEEIKDIIKYASERFITIIPEIDIPGHTLAVLASYPYLGCTGGPYKVGCEWGIYEDVLCAGNEETFIFLEDVMSEVADLFPSQYIHIGGDECLKNRWMACPKCQAKIKQLRLKGANGHSVGEELQSYFIARVEKMINAKGKCIIGWDEILEGGIAPNATIMSWRGTEGGIYAANKGHDVIMTPEQFVYLDYYQSPDVDNEPFTFGWLTELKKTYSFDPMPKNLPEDKQKHILGAQVNLWSEYMPAEQNVEYMLLPRMCALAETLWSNYKYKDYNNFLSRLYNSSKLFDKLGYENCQHAFGVQDSIVVDTINNKINLFLSTFDNSPIYYTMSDLEPNKESTLYTKNTAINIEKNTIFKAVTYRDNKKSDTYSKDFVVHKASAKPISLKYQPDSKYTFNGITTLVNAQEGTISSYRTGSWIGFLGTDMEATLDLKASTSFSTVSIDVFVNTRGNLFPPKSFTVYTSSDGKDYVKYYHLDYEEILEHISPKVVTRATDIKETQARYVKVIMESIKTLPQWHEKKGNKVFLMIDEIQVR
ncbi:family 20 glycosylhydrolase [Dysgonomonas sp. Marseille-P4677]|uniref:glycoside hydrolase family 20 protein n=1 Tax=Dysgonomonas sp. Marseille-P4677 TaxID=2364790 RepID=UPI001911373F|nr:family 20 glycosylhydrolase [Dysgonomonas sp. Marseille-P4677]MBK5722624.1 family 20 glycosylhydrolase [Dysgonomonas sp. Marseille-P4677]